MAKQSLSEKLEASRVLIFNSKESDVAPLLGEIGIDDDYITTGQNLYQETMELVKQQQKEYQEQFQAYDNYHLSREEAEEKMKKALKLVNIMARNDKDLQQRLNIPNADVGVLDVWIDDAIGFFNRLLTETEFTTKLSRFKYGPTEIQADQQLFEQLKTLKSQAISEKGQAQEATRLRNEKLEDLEDYTRELKAIAKLALESKPQLLEKLGILVRSN